MPSIVALTNCKAWCLGSIAGTIIGLHLRQLLYSVTDLSINRHSVAIATTHHLIKLRINAVVGLLLQWKFFSGNALFQLIFAIELRVVMDAIGNSGTWLIYLFTWIAPVFLLRFLRSQPLLAGSVLSVLALLISMIFGWQGNIPLEAMSPVQYIIFMLTAAGVAFIPYLCDRLLTPQMSGFAMTLVFPMARTLTEYLVSHISIFGIWGSQAYSVAGVLSLEQTVSVTGLWGLTFLISWLASVLVWLWEEQWRWHRVRLGAGIFITVVLILSLYGQSRLIFLPETHNDRVKVAAITLPPQLSEAWQAQVELQHQYRAGSLQPQESQPLIQASRAIQDYLFQQVERAADQGAKLVFWAEGDARVLKSEEAEFIQRFQRLVQAKGIYLGMAIGTLNSRPYRPIENKIVMLEPTGAIAWEYFKAHPFPGKETRSTVRGNGRLMTLNTPYGRIAGVFCFDTDFVNFMQQAAAAKVDILFAPSNDWQEVARPRAQMILFRGLEHGFSIVRPTQDGISLIADYHGRILAMTDATSSQHLLIASIPRQGIQTKYDLIGDRFIWVCVMGLAICAGWRYLRTKALPQPVELK